MTRSVTKGEKDRKPGRLFIRADGNEKLGVGHQMRCLSIADAFRKLGVEAVFLTADESGSILPKSRGYACIVLDTDYRNMDGELPKLLPLLENRPLFLLDSYFADRTYVEAVRGRAQVVYLDDYGKEYWPADGILNYNIYGPDMPYDSLYPGQKTEGQPLLLLGSRYAPLRQEFQAVKQVPKERVTDVLITTGGADACNVAGRLAARLVRDDGEPERTEMAAQNRGIRYHIISGVFHTFREELYALAAKHPEIVIHENVTRMAELMAQCDLAVSAAGSTLYELCAAGVPTAYFYFVENQLLPARYFAKETQMLSCGNFAEEPEETLERLYRAVRRLEQDSVLRKEVACSMERVTDGSGAERIAACLNERFLTDN